MNFQEKKGRQREKNSHKHAHNHGDKKQAKVFDHSPFCFHKYTRD